MINPWLWAGAVAIYVWFRAWYDNWRGPLKAAEVEAFMARVEAGKSAEGEVTSIHLGFRVFGVPRLDTGSA